MQASLTVLYNYGVGTSARNAIKIGATDPYLGILYQPRAFHDMHASWHASLHAASHPLPRAHRAASKEPSRELLFSLFCRNGLVGGEGGGGEAHTLVGGLRDAELRGGPAG
jgi:hypothetical protein